MTYFKQAMESIRQKKAESNDACASTKTEQITRFDSRFRVQEILLISTILPVVFLDLYTVKAWIAAIVVILEGAAFVLSFLKAIEQAKNGQKHPFLGILQFLLVALVVNLCLLVVCRMKYMALFVDESEKFMMANFLQKGYRLYDTIFCHHGPFTVMLSHLFYLLHPVNDIGIFRAPGFLVLLLPSILFLFLDIIPKRTLRITVSLLFPSSYLLINYLYSSLKGDIYPPSAIVLYQFYGSVFIGCALILLYPLLFHDKYNKWHLFWAGMFLSFSFFCAISFAISIFLIIAMAGIFFLCNYPETEKKFFTLLFFVYGGIAGFLLVLIYLVAFGSVRGFIEQHVIFNMLYYAKYIGYDGTGSSYMKIIQGIPQQVLHGRIFYLVLLTVFVLLYPLFYSAHAGNMKKTVLHFVYSVMFFLVALFSGRYSPFEAGFTPVNQSGYVVLILAECALLAGLTTGRVWIVIAVGFITLVTEKIPQCHLTRSAFALMKQKEIVSSEVVQNLTGPEDPVLFYPLGFSDYIGENRLPGGVFFPFMTAWVYEYGRDRMFDEIRKTPPVMIYFYYSDTVWYENDPMISEILAFMRDQGYKQVHGTDYYILPEACSRQEALAQYELDLIARQYLNADPGALHPFDEINRDREFSDTLLYPYKLGDRMVTGISFLIPTYLRMRPELDGTMEVRFLDAQGETMEVFSMDVPDIMDNQPYLFAFEKPCRPTSIRITSTSSPQKGFTLWLDPNNHLSLGMYEDTVSLSRGIHRGPASASIPD